MLTRLNFTRNLYVSSVFLSAVAFVLLNAPVSAVDTPKDAAMTVLSMDDMELLAGGTHVGPWGTPFDYAASTPKCGLINCHHRAYRSFKTCGCDGPPSWAYCGEYWVGAPQWIEYSCKNGWLGLCTIDTRTGSGGDIHDCRTYP